MCIGLKLTAAKFVQLLQPTANQQDHAYSDSEFKPGFAILYAELLDGSVR